jgi:hypothetical protein
LEDGHGIENDLTLAAAQTNAGDVAVLRLLPQEDRETLDSLIEEETATRRGG